MPSVLNTASIAASGLQPMIYATRDVFSAEIYFAALPVLKFDQFTTKKTELGVQRGKTIIMPRIGNMKRGGPLLEGHRMQTRSMAMSQQSITVNEYGNALAFSEFLLQTSFFDQMSAASFALGRDMALVLDTGIRDTFRMATNVIWPKGKTARNQVGATDVFDTQLIKDAVEVLETNNVPKWNGDHYVCFIDPHQGRTLRDDNDWINVNQYANAQAIYNGEIGRYEDVRFISTSAMANGANGAVDPNTGDYANIGFDPNLAGAGNGGVNIHQALFFGEYAVGHATALPVELRDNGVVDFGREHGLAWYAIWGQGILENQNIVLVETA